MSVTQLIDADGNFTGTLPTPPGSSTRNYSIVAVVGCQSGGKSTLLNHAFRTAFPVLDAPRAGRRRTTLGIWAALPPTSASHPVVLLDVEGTDSRERGEGAKHFESRTTLFTLALADCVLVNMWAHDIGRYSAANYDLFETVFAHSIALRRSANLLTNRPVSILIVVRDHDPDVPVPDIRRVLMGDLANIWDSLNPPNLSLSDLFNIDVLALPHKLYSPAAFDDAVHHLGARISAESRPAQDAHPVPLDAFDSLAKSVWNAVTRCISGNRSPAQMLADPSNAFSLDLPKQAVLAAHFRCGEIAADLWRGEIGRRLDDLRVDIETQWQNPLSDFGSRVTAIVRDAFAAFDEATASYVNSPCVGDAVDKRRVEYGTELASRVSELRERFLSVCWDFNINAFEDKFRPMLGGTNGFERRARRLAKSQISQYRSMAQDAVLPPVLSDFVEVKDVDPEEAFEDGEGVVAVAEVDVIDVQLGLADSEDDDGEDEYSVERFRKEVMRKVEERKRLGEVLLPGANGEYGPIGVKREPWWKGLLIRGVILLINYLQATHGQRAALKLHRQHEKEFPPGPTF